MNPSRLTALFRPRSVAVVGASRDPHTVGGAVFANLVRGGFQGPVYPVHATASWVQSLRAWPTLESLPEVPDLIAVAVPAPHVPEVVRQAAALRVPAAVILTGGFGEVGEEGRRVELQLRELARASGMRILGPNCLGVLNPDPAVRLDATFGTRMPPHGTIAFASQSGGLGVAAIDYAADLGIGFSAFASLGNKADISGNDVLEFFERDPGTRTVLLYLESFGNPTRFREIAARVGREKPIVLVKSGRSGAGARAAGSHTGSMSGPDASITALCAQAGVLRADTMEELFDVAILLTDQPLPPGRRVGVVTNAGGPGILAADALEANGLLCPPLGGMSQAQLREFLKPAAAVSNPVDVLADASPETFGRALRVALADPDIHAALAMYVPPITGDAVGVAHEIVAAARDAKKPVMACLVGSFGVAEAQALLRKSHVPCYRFPEAPARALALAVGYAEWRETPAAAPEPPPGPNPGAAQVLELARHRLGNSGGWLNMDECAAFAKAWGLPVAPFQILDAKPELAEDAARSLGFPVVMKADVPGIVHKTEAHAVALHLQSADQVRAAATRMLRLEPSALVVQKEISDGEEWLVGSVLDPKYGPLITVGAGGVRTELIHDIHQRLAPLSERDIEALLSTPRVGRTLPGFRGAPPADARALRTFIRNLSRAAVAHREIGELEANPVKVRADGQGAVALDLRIHLLARHP